MFRAFNLTQCGWSKVDRKAGDVILQQNRETVRKSLESFLNDHIIDGTKLTQHWFPTVKADVFISHSHKDEEDAIKYAGWLKSVFNLDPFVDSCVWGCADTLLKLIDDKYCRNPGGDTYSYEKRNGSTSHIHMMLSTALSAMLDATECVVFINTRNSITSTESIDKTQSPWLSFELGTMRVIRRKKPTRRIIQLETFSRDRVVKASTDYTAEYEVPLDELTPLSGGLLEAWRLSHQSAHRADKHALDLLYEIAPEHI